MDKKTYVLNFLENTIKNSLVGTSRFAEEFSKDPGEALRWSQDAFIHGAWIKACRHTIRMFEEEYANVDSVCRGIREQVIGMAKNPCRSSSLASVLFWQCLAEAYAEIFETLERVIRDDKIF